MLEVAATEWLNVGRVQQRGSPFGVVDEVRAAVLRESGFVRVDHVGDSLCVVELEGEHDISTVAELHQRLDALLGQTATVLIDLSAATFIDSAILYELVQAQRRVDRTTGQELAVIAPPGAFSARLFGQVGFETLVSVFETRADALPTYHRPTLTPDPHHTANIAAQHPPTPHPWWLRRTTG